MEQPITLNGLVLYVTNVTETLKVYKELGFSLVHNRAPSYGSVRLGDFLIQFQDKRNPTDPDFVQEAMAEPKGGGLFVYIQVADVDRYYQTLIDQGTKVATQPRDWPSGFREFVVRDPDGYKLVFYEPRGLT